MDGMRERLAPPLRADRRRRAGRVHPHSQMFCARPLDHRIRSIPSVSTASTLV